MIANNFSEKYINPRGDPYTELPGDDQSSENTESDTVAEETEKEPTLFQKFKELLSDIFIILIFYYALECNNWVMHMSAFWMHDNGDLAWVQSV